MAPPRFAADAFLEAGGLGGLNSAQAFLIRFRFIAITETRLLQLHGKVKFLWIILLCWLHFCEPGLEQQEATETLAHEAGSLSLVGKS